MFGNGFSVEEELGSLWTFGEKIACSLSNPTKYRLTGVSLEDKECNHLLHEETDNNCRPWDSLAVVGENVQDALEHDNA